MGERAAGRGWGALAADEVMLLTGEGLAKQKDAAGARKLFLQFEELYPGNPLLAEVRLAISRTYEAEGKWDAAITNYGNLASTATGQQLSAIGAYNQATGSEQTQLLNYAQSQQANALGQSQLAGNLAIAQGNMDINQAGQAMQQNIANQQQTANYVGGAVGAVGAVAGAFVGGVGAPVGAAAGMAAGRAAYLAASGAGP